MLKLARKRKAQGEDFNYAEFKLEFFCENCMGFVLQRSKHCGYCNRCTSKFDHHCKWINNCIGGQNYNLFLIMVTNIWIQLVISMSVHGVLISRFNSNVINYN